MRGALRDLTDGIRWRALIAAWSLTLVAVAILTVADASQAMVSLVLAGAAAVVALCVVGDSLAARALPGATAVADDGPSAEEQVVTRPATREAQAPEAPTAPRPAEIREPAGVGRPERREPHPQDAKMILAANLRRLRKQRGWSQEMLAHFAGLHATEVSRLERGLREPRMNTVLQVAAVLKVDLDELLLRPGEREPEGEAEDERAGVSPPRSEDD